MIWAWSKFRRSSSLRCSHWDFLRQTSCAPRRVPVGSCHSHTTGSVAVRLAGGDVGDDGPGAGVCAMAYDNDAIANTIAADEIEKVRTLYPPFLVR